MQITPVCNGKGCPDRYECERYLSRNNSKGGMLDGAVQMSTKGGCNQFKEAEAIPTKRRGCTGCGFKS